jgi:hypothetical protein
MNCLILMTCHGSVDDVFHNHCHGMKKTTRKWWAVPQQMQRVDEGGLRGRPPGQRQQ